MFLKPTTPTSAGLAQVFDTSAIVQQAYQERQNREERLQKHALEYDPSKMWDKHIPEYQARYSELQDFVKEHHTELLNSKDNMEIWQQYKAKQNDIKNFVAIAAQDMTNSYQALNSMSNDKYANAKNKEILDAKFRKPTSRDFYKTPDWALNVVPLMKRNANVDLSGWARVMEGRAKKVTSLDPELKKMVESAAPGSRYMVTREDLVYDRDDAVELMRQAFLEDPDLQEVYGSPDVAADALMGRVRTDSEVRISQVREKPEKTAKEPSAGFWKMQVMPGTSEDKPLVDQKFITPDGGDVSVPSTQNIRLSAKPQSILLFPNIRIRTQFKDVYSLRDGAAVADPEKYKDGIMLKYTVSRRVRKGQMIELENKDGNKTILKEGDYLPDFTDRSVWNVTESKQADYDRLSYEQESAIMYAGTDALELLSQMRENQVTGESVYQFLADQNATGEFVSVPFKEVYPTLTREMAAQSNGQYNLSAIMNQHRQNLGMDIWNGVQKQ